MSAPASPPPSIPTTVIDARELVRAYPMGERPLLALDRVDLQVRQGEWVALIGPSGSGKSTLLAILGLLDRPSSGSYLLDGQPVEKLDDLALARVRNRRLGFVFQAFNLLPGLRADENVALPLRYAGVSRPERLARARAALERVGLGDRANHKPGELSGGQCQRVAVARALVSDPAVILADEPTGNLDSSSGAAVLELFRELHRAGRTIVMVTHDPDIARSADRRVALADGRVVSDG